MNELAMNKLEDSVKESYNEPVNEKFEDATDSILARLTLFQCKL